MVSIEQNDVVRTQGRTFTVATPGAPAVRADSSGETPPNAAPYPTLVGTAICTKSEMLVQPGGTCCFDHG